MTLRLATPRDRDFLTAMLVEAVNWNPTRAPLTRERVLAEPKLGHYVDGWPRAGDTGLVALDPAGVAVGAACRREGLRSGEMKLVRERLHHDRARPGAERGGCSAALRNVRPPYFHLRAARGVRTVTTMPRPGPAVRG